MESNTIQKLVSGLESPAESAFSITPSDTTTQVARGIYIGGNGSLKVLMYKDTTPVTFSNVTEGMLLPIIVQKIYATGTTATSLIGLL